MSTRQLSAVQYDRRDLEMAADGTSVRGIVRWRQLRLGQTTHRSSFHHDELAARMVYTESGTRERKSDRVPRYTPELRDEVHAAAEKLCDLIEDTTHLEVVKFGYAPGSEVVDVWTGKEEGDEQLVLHYIDAPELHEAAHAFAALVATRIASEPDQPVDLLSTRVTK